MLGKKMVVEVRQRTKAGLGEEETMRDQFDRDASVAL